MTLLQAMFGGQSNPNAGPRWQQYDQALKNDLEQNLAPGEFSHASPPEQNRMLGKVHHQVPDPTQARMTPHDSFTPSQE
ncbi:MAG TPA: hypothetical protein VGO93_08780 [Candidatus Xenobia bacterium]|jgi:hypothetical protein